MNDYDKQRLLKSLSPEEITHRYQQAIQYFLDGAKTGVVDKTEYRVFQETLPKRDLSAAAHAWLNMLITYDEYFNIVQTIVAFDLMVQSAIDGNIKAKSNGEDKDKEVDVDGDIISLEDE